MIYGSRFGEKQSIISSLMLLKIPLHAAGPWKPLAASSVLHLTTLVLRGDQITGKILGGLGGCPETENALRSTSNSETEEDIESFLQLPVKAALEREKWPQESI